MTKGSFRPVASKEDVYVKIAKSYVVEGKYVPLTCIYQAVKEAVGNDATKIQRFRNCVAAGKYAVTTVVVSGSRYGVRMLDAAEPMNTGNASIILHLEFTED